MPQKLVIGITGTFGSGKSTVAHMFQTLGAFGVNSDVIAHEALMDGGPLYEEVAGLFPDARLKGGKELDRKKIAKVIFENSKMRKKLEAVVHPYVFSRLVEEIHESKEKVVVVEVPLLFEADFDRVCDKTLVVKTTEQKMNKRLREKGFSLKEIRARRKAQMSLKAKEKRADFIIDNSGTIDQTRKEVKKIWENFKPALKGAA